MGTDDATTDAATAAIRELLTDTFNRIAELVEEFADCPADIATYRPGPGANTIAWLIWHVARVQDDHVAGIDGGGQAWIDDGWYERLGLPFPAEEIGYGHTSDEVAQVRTPLGELVAYHADVHRRSLAYVQKVTPAELDRVVDTRWDPPVTASARLVSLTGDCLQHLGQAAYIRGLATQ